MPPPLRGPLPIVPVILFLYCLFLQVNCQLHVSKELTVVMAVTQSYMAVQRVWDMESGGVYHLQTLQKEEILS